MRSITTIRGNRWAIALASVWMIFTFSSGARAALVVTAVADTTNSWFEITLKNDSSSPFDLTSYQLEIKAGPDTQFEFIDPLTSPPYVFDNVGLGPPLSFDSFPNTQTIISDVVFASPSYVTLAAGETYGLARVGYSLTASGATASIELLLDGANTAFYAPQAADLVPAPSALLLFASGNCLLLLAALKSRFRRTNIG
jgi:hypothetical protein